MTWVWIGIGLLLFLPLLSVVLLLILHWYLRIVYIPIIERIFQEPPIFLVPRGEPRADAEDVTITTSDGIRLRGCYLKARTAPRQGVILLGLEYGSNRWSCSLYCEHLLETGYDVFTYEPRNQGDSEREPGLETLQWHTDRDLRDVQAAVAYLKARADADPRGIGFFGISKGAGAGILAADSDPYLRCAVTDGMFAAYSTILPYMRHFMTIYNKNYFIQGLLPMWYYGILARVAMRRVGRQRGVTYLHLEPALRRFRRPLLMVHGGQDNYIRPYMAMALYEYAKEPKEFWLIPKANHNRGLEVAGEEYRRRVRDFFDRHLGMGSGAPLRKASASR